MSSTVDDVSGISAGGLNKQELLDTVVQEDVLHTSTVLPPPTEVIPKLVEEQEVRKSSVRVPEGVADSTTDPLVVLEQPADDVLEEDSHVPSSEKMLTEPDSTGSPPLSQMKTSPLSEVPSLGPDLTITEISEDQENDEKKSTQISAYKVENQTINGSVQDAIKTTGAHLNGVVSVNGKKSTNGSSDYTPSVIAVNSDDEKEEETVSGEVKSPELPAMKWGIMSKKSRSPQRPKKLVNLAPKPVPSAMATPQPLSPAGAALPPPPELFVQLVRVPQCLTTSEKYTPPTSTSTQQQEDAKSKPMLQQQCSGNVQRPTALVNPFPAQKLARDTSGLVTICKGTQVDGGGETVTIPAIVVNGPLTAKSPQDFQDLDKKNVCVVPKVINRQHHQQRWTQTTLLDFHRIKNNTTTTASNIQPVSATATLPVHQQPLAVQQTQLRSTKSVGSSTVGAAAMLTPVMAKLQAGGTVCVTGTGPNAVLGCLIQNKSDQDDTTLLQQLLATQQAAAAAAASVAEQTGSSVAVIGAVDLQSHSVATTPAEMSVIDMLKRLGTVVELEEQKDPPPSGDLVTLTTGAPGAEQPLVVSNALALLESIKIDKPQSPVVKALEDSPASSPTSQVNKHCSIPPIPTTTFYLGKDISVFPHVTPPVPSHIPVTPVPIQPKRTTCTKSTSTQLSSAPTQPRLPPDVSVFATTRNPNNAADSKTVQQWSLTSLVKQVKGCLSPKHQPQHHPILEEVNQLTAQRNRLNQQQRSNQLTKQQQQVIGGQQLKSSPKRKSSLTKEPPQYNHVALHHLEPEIDIVEGDNVLSSEGTFIFNMDSFFNVDLPNNDMIYSCDICSAVYQHPHRLKKHYLRLHIARKYIAKRDLDAFNIVDSKSEYNEEDSDVEKGSAKMEETMSNDSEIKLVFRCHTCRKCVATKAELKSHLTDHPPLVDLKKQVVKGVKNYKCDYCSVFFKWKKMFLKHKKNCRLQPSIQGTTIPAPATTTEPLTTFSQIVAKPQAEIEKPKKTSKTSLTSTANTAPVNTAKSSTTTTTTTTATTSVSKATEKVSATSRSFKISATSTVNPTAATTTVLAVISSTSTISSAKILSNSPSSNTPATVVTSANKLASTSSSASTSRTTKGATSNTSTTKATSLITSTKVSTTSASATTKAVQTTKNKSSSTSTPKASSSFLASTKSGSTKSSTKASSTAAHTSTNKTANSSATTKSTNSTTKSKTTKSPVTNNSKNSAAVVVKARRARNSLKNVIRLLHHCLYCNETFHNGNSKRNHTLSNHPYVRKVHPCVFCHRDFVSNSLLFTHLLAEHPTVYFACATCKDRFTNLQELGTHNDRKHSLDDVEKLAFGKRISTIKQTKDCYTCQKCQRMFVMESCYKSHKCTPPEQQATSEGIKREKNSTTPLNTSTASNCSPDASFSSITASNAANTSVGSSAEKPDSKPVNKIRAKKAKHNEREMKTDIRAQPFDPEVAFFSQVSRNVRDNLQNHLDGRLVQSGDDSGDDMGTSGKADNSTKSLLKTPEIGRRTRSPKIINRLSVGSSTAGGGGAFQQKGGTVGNSALSRTSIGQDDKRAASSSTQNQYNKPRASPWEKYAFPTKYDGRCGLTSYIKDISCLDISTQLLMRRNMQNLQYDGDFMEEDLYPNGEKGDVPSVLALERMAAKCAESYSNDDSTLNGGDDPLNNDGISSAIGELSGEWVRERTYVCQVCGWETHCLWSMEDHKYEVHPSVVCPRLELVGDQRKLAKKIYTRLTDAPAPFPSSSLDKPSTSHQEITCTKCNSKGFATAPELHVHLLECAGEKVPEWIRNAVSGTGRSQTPRKRKWSRKRRRPRRGLKRNIPNTPQKPNKTRSKPGDTDTIQKMIANLPAKRLTRRVIAFDEKDLKTRSQSHIQNNRLLRKRKKPPLQQQSVKSSTSKTTGTKSKNNGHLAQQHNSLGTGGAIGVANDNKLENSSPKTMTPETSPTSLTQTNNIDTSAEGGDVLSSLRMMPVSTPRQELLGTQQILDRVLGLSARVKEEEAALSSGIKCTGCGQAYESKTVLRRHHKSCAYFRECGPISQHQCQTCHKTFDNLVALIEHTCEEIPPRLEAEESTTSNAGTVSNIAVQMDIKDIPVLSPVLEGENKVDSKARGEKAHKNSSTLPGEFRDNIIIPIVVKEENLEHSKQNPLSQNTSVQTVNHHHFALSSNDVASSMIPITSTTKFDDANSAAVAAAATFLNVPLHSIKTASLICGISFVDGFIKYETVNSVSKETEQILELTDTKKDDNLNKRGRPKRKSGEEAAVAVFQTMNSGRRSISGGRASKNLTPKIRQTKGIKKKSVLTPNEMAEQATENVVSSNSPVKRIQKRGRGKRKLLSTEVRSAIQEPVVSSDSPENEIKVNMETGDEEDVAKIGNDGKEVTVTPIAEHKVRRKRKWSNSPIKKKVKVKPNAEEGINNTQTPSPNKSEEILSPTGEVKRKRGRPFGSLSRKKNGLPKRRSSRCRARNPSSTMETIPSPTSSCTNKFGKQDDIHLFDEDEVLTNDTLQKKGTDKSPSKQTLELETPEKKRRNRWSGKQQQQSCRDNSPDTTTIIVQAEVHPEPSPRRVKKEFKQTCVEELMNLEESPSGACIQGPSLGWKKRNEPDEMLQLKSIKKPRTEVGLITSVDEISVLEVEEIVMDNASANEEEITSRAEKLESSLIVANVTSCPAESNFDGVPLMNEVKQDLNVVSDKNCVYAEEVPSEELVNTTVNEIVNIETQDEEIVQEPLKNIGEKKLKKKVKKKNKETTVGVPRTTSSQHSVKKSKKITKDEKLKKNIKAAALSIAKLKKKKKILQKLWIDRINKIKNDKRKDNKKEVVKVAGFSWEVSELSKSPEKSPVSVSTGQLENYVAKSMDPTCSSADSKDSTMKPQTVCSCSSNKSPQQAAGFTATATTRVLQVAQANPPSPATFHYTLTKEDWLSQTTAPLASSTVHQVHPVPNVQQLATSSVSQTLCTLQPAVLNQHQQQAPNSITSLIQQVGASQTSIELTQPLSMQEEDVSVSSPPVVHKPQISCVQTALLQNPRSSANVEPSVTQPELHANSLQLTENPLMNVSQSSVDQISLPQQQVSPASLSYPVTQTPVQAMSVYVAPVSPSQQLQYHSLIPAPAVDQMVIPPPPSFQTSPPPGEPQVQISSITSQQSPVSFQSSVNPTPSISTELSSQHHEIVSAAAVQSKNTSSLAMEPNMISSTQTPQIQCYPTINQPLPSNEGTIRPVLLHTLQSKPSVIVQNQQNFTPLQSQQSMEVQNISSLPVLPTQMSEQSTIFMPSASSETLPLTTGTSQLPSCNNLSSHSLTPLIKATGSNQDCNPPPSSSQLIMDQQLPIVSSSTVAPSIGTIIDSVNKLLNEPDLSAGGYSPLSHYNCLTDIHNYCTEDDISVLQHLGEVTAEEVDEIPDVKPITRLPMLTEIETDYWSPSDSKSLMDLDHQPQEQPLPVLTTTQQVVSNTASTSSIGYGLNQENTNRSLFNLQQIKDYHFSQNIRRKRASPSLKFMDAYEGKEVVCPTCHSQFLGFSALQAHVEKAHNSHSAQSSGTNSGQMTSISRRLVLESCKGIRRVCHICQQILPANLMTSHLSDEHAIEHSSFLRDPNQDQDPACGERLKTKLATALGDLLDKAVHNLVLSKPRPESQLSAGAAELLSRICALRMKEKQKLNQQNVQSKLKLNEKTSDTEDLGGTKVKELTRSFPCEFCGLKFMSAGTKKKHQKLAHPSVIKAPDQTVDTNSDVDEYENDWRGVPSPNSSNNDGTGDSSDSFHPTCSECGLSFSSLSEIMRHRAEDHGRQGRRLSSDIGLSGSRPHTPSSVHNSNVSCGSGSGSATPNNTVSVSSASNACLNSITAASLANTLSRLQQRTRSSSVETQSSCGGSSVTTTTSSSRGGRAGSRGRRGGSSGRTVLQAQLKMQQQSEQKSEDSNSIGGDCGSSSNEEAIKGKTRRTANRKSNTPNSKKQQSTSTTNTTTSGGGAQQKGSRNSGGRQPRGGRATRKGSAQKKTRAVSEEEAAKAKQALRQVSLDRTGPNTMRSTNRITNATTSISTETTAASEVKTDSQLPSEQSNILT
ncbi:uncharacterized protein isoform X6 [Rhodnius prolixus]|uniref:uncharacterized protein isoform X6 n=1 Tax=Rhodnius prolixus TaxID=13249 RepID=UPI003D18AEFF